MRTDHSSKWKWRQSLENAKKKKKSWVIEWWGNPAGNWDFTEKEGDVCRHRHPGTFSGLAGRELCLASDRDRRLLHLITFCPKGRQLWSLILAFVARGESLCCSNPQLSSRHQETVTGLLGSSSAVLAVCSWDKCRLLPPLLARFPLVNTEGEPTERQPKPDRFFI